MNSIKDIRQITKMSQKQFSDYFGIPIGTIRNWEQGISNPPSYVYSMIFTSIRRDKMINVETIKFTRLLDHLAALSSNGIEDFSLATEDTYYEKLFYDSESPTENGHFPVVADACIVDDPECIHHDIVSYYDTDEYTISAVRDPDDGSIYVSVKFKYYTDDDEIIIDKGEWYFC